MKTLRSFFMIVNYKTFIVSSLSLASTHLCHITGLVANFPLTLVSLAIVFPIVFSINSAYKRREHALQQYAIIKGHLIGIFYASRDWIDYSPNPYPQKFAIQFEHTLRAIKKLLMQEEHNSFEHDKLVYLEFDKLSKLIQELREVGLNASEISRANQYLSKAIVAFETMRNIAYYRTPITLRAYSKVFIYSFPIIYGSYFAYTFSEYETHLAYMMPVLYCFILVSLTNIQEFLEHPYDEIGEDDIHLDVREITEILNP
ncbi:hypothetical protein ACE193_05915 [Bernardetia sp. OM2101]|uniref:hypothetical protein n=1 Tax=Bernardetia sp. OM2101 TaxID=3344876 RepID=UPI0035D00170